MTAKASSSGGSGEAEKQFNARLPESLHRRLKAQCALDGYSMADAMACLAQAYLDGKVKLPKKPITGA